MANWQHVRIKAQGRREEITDRALLYRVLTIVSFVLVVLFIVLVIAGFRMNMTVMLVVGLVGLCASGILLGRYSRNPDRLTADQTNRMLRLASDTLRFMRIGLTEQSAHEVCAILLPLTEASSVALIREGVVMGNAGYEEIWETIEDPIPIPYSPQRFEYGAKYVIRSVENDDPSAFPTNLKACISAPLIIQDVLVGALKMYYTRHKEIDETQQATAVGFAELLSTQLALAELDAKTELATKMELRALQAQINPHFLFNTINTIASLIRTDPGQARVLLREFATFYRRTLDNSQDLISIELELNQTLRYLGFERARFGAEKIQLTSFVEPGLEKLLVPAFIVQPIVENAVGHAMRPDGETLHIHIEVKRQGEDVVISVADDGVGMDTTEREVAVNKGRSKGAGIALKNVHERLRSCFGAESGIHIESTLGVGTTVYLKLTGAKVEESSEEDAADEEGGNLD